MKEIRGVAVILFNPDRTKIFVVREKKSKIGLKKVGDISVPAETLHNKENVLAGFFRAINEEIGVNVELRGQIFVGTRQIAGLNIEVSYYIATAKQEYDVGALQPSDGDDVEPVGWMSVADFAFAPNVRRGIKDGVMWALAVMSASAPLYAQ